MVLQSVYYLPLSKSVMIIGDVDTFIFIISATLLPPLVRSNISPFYPQDVSS